ncbi:MAG: FAD-binding protein [Pedosphaera sp.]|nr:FAD-binding protein [Pedosphaera sp.]
MLLEQLSRELAPGELSFEAEDIAVHSGDKWFARHPPEAVVRPGSVASVARIMAWATAHRIPVTPRGSGYGYVGGCVPVEGGIALSLAGLKRIRSVSALDFTAVVESGVITATLQAAVERKGLYYPPDPASRADCSIGGNIATNAGGPRCLKYGVTRDYVLGLQVVLVTGEVVRLGGKTHKNKTGFDLHRLFVGSEGMLGVVTEVTLKLLPLPPYRACLGVGFVDIKTAAKAIRAIFAAGFLPSALEVADAFTIAAARKRTGSPLLRGAGALMIVELDGHQRSVRGEISDLDRLLRPFNPTFCQKGLGPEGCERFWALRREFSYSLRDTGLTKLNEDVVVPRGKLEALFRLGAAIQKRHGIQVACFGHAGDGNIHVNLMVDESRPAQRLAAEAGLDHLFRGVLELGGSITGEHGVGLAKKPWWTAAVSPEADRLHRRIKSTLDPDGILNPGKFLG